MKRFIYLALVVLAAGCATRKGVPKLTPIPRVYYPPILNLSFITSTNLVMQVTGGTDYVKYKSGGVEVSGTILMSAYMGDSWQLSWNTKTNEIYTIQYSDDLTAPWKEISVWFYGDGNAITWLDYPTNIRFYRLKVQNL